MVATFSDWAAAASAESAAWEAERSRETVGAISQEVTALRSLEVMQQQGVDVLSEPNLHQMTEEQRALARRSSSPGPTPTTARRRSQPRSASTSPSSVARKSARSSSPR